jgi:probable F420-dependent oxidoreductase
MQFGITMFSTELAISPAELAREAETRGYSSLFVPEHTHIPTSRRTPPPTGDAELPEEYRHTLDPFVALATAAAVTSRIRVGTGVCLVFEHDVLALAKQVATLDHLSRGRFVFGIGYGWNREEMADHGVEFRSRRARTREMMLAMQTLWSNERAAFAGEFVRFEESWAWPKPAQQPRPPVLIGGAPGPKLFAHIAEYGDGWIPIGGAGVKAALPELRAAMEKAGRNPSEAKILPFGTIPDAGKLEYYASIGIEEVVLRIPSASREVVLPVLDEYAKWVERGWC